MRERINGIRVAVVGLTESKRGITDPSVVWHESVDTARTDGCEYIIDAGQDRVVRVYLNWPEWQDSNKVFEMNTDNDDKSALIKSFISLALDSIPSGEIDMADLERVFCSCNYKTIRVEGRESEQAICKVADGLPLMMSQVLIYIRAGEKHSFFDLAQMSEDIYTALEERVEETDDFQYILVPFDTDETLDSKELEYSVWWR